MGTTASGGETTRTLADRDGTLVIAPAVSSEPARVVEAEGAGRCGGAYPDGLDYTFRPMYIRVGYQR